LELLKLFYGAVVGLLLGLTGAGGSIVSVPILIYLLGYDAHAATGTSLIIVGTGALAGVVQYFLTARQRIQWAAGVLFSLLGFLGVGVGSYVNTLLPSAALLYSFGLLMLVVGIYTLRKRSSEKESPFPFRFRLSGWGEILRVTVAALGVGFLTGLFGVGGGFLIVPALLFVLNFPMREALATSLLVITLNSAEGVIARLLGLGKIHFGGLIFLSLGTILGIGVGVVLVRHLPARLLGKIFAWFVIAVGVYMILRTYFLGPGGIGGP